MNVAIEPGKWCALGSQRQMASSAPAIAKSSRWRGDNGSSATRAPLIKTGLKYSTMLTAVSCSPCRQNQQFRAAHLLTMDQSFGSKPLCPMLRAVIREPSYHGRMRIRRQVDSKSTSCRRRVGRIQERSAVDAVAPRPCLFAVKFSDTGTRRLELTVAASDSSVIVLRIAVSKYEIPPAQARALGGEPAAKSRIRIPARHGRGRGRNK